MLNGNKTSFLHQYVLKIRKKSLAHEQGTLIIIEYMDGWVNLSSREEGMLSDYILSGENIVMVLVGNLLGS